MAGVVLILLGTAWLLNLWNVIDLRAALVLPVLLGLVGLALLAGSFRGPHPGLIVFGTLLSLVTAFAAFAPSEALRGGVGERHHLVTSMDELQSRYELAVGDMVLDLTELTLTGNREVLVTIGAGDLNVIVPDDMPVLITASSGAGEIVFFEERDGGLAVERAYRSSNYDQKDASLKLNLELGAGSIEVAND